MSVILTVTDTGVEHTAESALSDAENDHKEQDDDEENARDAELVVFDGTTQGLGLKIFGGCSVDGRQDDGIFIKRLLVGGLAHRQGGLEGGDLILDVNGQSMEGITYDRALSILRQASASNHVEMVITRDEEARVAFLDVLSRAMLNTQSGQEKQDSYAPKPTVNGDHIIHTDNIDEYSSLVEGFYKETVDHQSDAPLNEINIDVMDNINSSCSPVSSCDSEMARHLPPDLYPRDLSQTGDPKSLNNLLSHSFPMAVNSVNPNCRFPFTKLEATLQSLGFVISAEKHLELLKNIPIDDQGLTTFDDFVRAVRQVFDSELQTRRSSYQCSSPRLVSSPSPRSPSLAGEQFSDGGLHHDNDQLRREIQSLKEELKEQKQLCQKAEEQVLSLRKESQAAMDESRSLRTKLRLAEQAKEAAQKMEQDYEQVIAMLENEISHLRLQISKSDGLNEHRRLAVAACQLKKAEAGKKTFEVATNKLLAHVQHVDDVLTSDPSRRGDAEKGDKKKRKEKAIQGLVAEGKDVIRTVHTLMEQVPLPFGWEENYTADGVRYYINHLNQTTSWTHPSSNVEHQSATGTRPPAFQLPSPHDDRKK